MVTQPAISDDSLSWHLARIAAATRLCVLLDGFFLYKNYLEFALFLEL